MDGNAGTRLRVETFFKEACPYCKDGKTCRFHSILDEIGIDPMNGKIIDIRRLDKGKKYSIRLLYHGKSQKSLEITVSIPNPQISLIVENGKERKSIMTFHYSPKIYHEIFLIANEGDIEKLKNINEENFKKAFRNTFGD